MSLNICEKSCGLKTGRRIQLYWGWGCWFGERIINLFLLSFWI